MASEIFERLLKRVPEETKRKVHKDLAEIKILHDYLALFGYTGYEELIKNRSIKELDIINDQIDVAIDIKMYLYDKKLSKRKFLKLINEYGKFDHTIFKGFFDLTKSDYELLTNLGITNDGTNK